MRALARQVDLMTCPPAVARFATPGQVFLTVGRHYDVFALAVFEGQPLFQVVDDLRYPAWLPSWLFDVVDPALPSDWIGNVFREEPSFVAGPDFVAKDQAAYGRMVELEAHEVDLFWKRVDASIERPEE